MTERCCNDEQLMMGGGRTKEGINNDAETADTSEAGGVE